MLCEIVWSKKDLQKHNDQNKKTWQLSQFVGILFGTCFYFKIIEVYTTITGFSKCFYSKN